MTTSLPNVLREIAEAAGLPAAIALAARCGGTRVYIPARVTDGHWLADCVGREAADAICKLIGGGEVDIPLGNTGAYPQLRRTIAKRVHELDQAGASAATIARRASVTERTVRRHRRAHAGGGKGDKQGSLL